MKFQKDGGWTASLRDEIADSPDSTKEIYEEVSPLAVGGGGSTMLPSTNSYRDLSHSRRKRTKLGSKVESKAEVLELRSYLTTVLGSPQRPRR